MVGDQPVPPLNHTAGLAEQLLRRPRARPQQVRLVDVVQAVQRQVTRSRPDPVSTDRNGSGLSAPRASWKNCMKTPAFQISM